MYCFQLKSLIISIVIILLNVFVVLSNDSPFNDDNVSDSVTVKSENAVKSNVSTVRPTLNNARSTATVARSAVSTTSRTYTTNSGSTNSIPITQSEDVSKGEAEIISFNDFLKSINFSFTEPKENSTIFENSYLDVKWDCNFVEKEMNPFRNISVVLENQTDHKGYYIETGIDLNKKEGKYYIGSLNETSREYALWLATGNETEGINYFRGPGIINGNSNVVIDNTPKVNEEDNKEKGGFLPLKFLILLPFIGLIFGTILIYLIVIAIKNKRNRSNDEDCKEYQEYKGYTNVSPSINKLLGLDEIYEKENKKNDKDAQHQVLSNSTNSLQSINTLAEQLYKAEQVYNNKVLKSPDINNKHCAPLVDMSNLYKQNQEITKVNTDNDIKQDNPYYKSKVLNTNKGKVQKGIMKNQNNYGIVNSEVNRNEEESFLVFDKYNEFGRSDSVNSNKILAQSESFTSVVGPVDNSKNDQPLLQKPFNIFDSSYKKNGNNEESDEINTVDEDYINKNSFCLNSKDSIDTFENLYLNKQNIHDTDIKETKKISPLVATVTTVEEYIEAHRNSLKEQQRHIRSSSLMTSSSASSSINSIVVSSALNNLPKMIGNSNQTSGPSSGYVPSPLKNKEKDNIRNSESFDNKINKENKRISESDNNNSSIVVDSSLNSSIVEEINSLEKQIQQQKQQQMYRLQQKSGNYQQNIDPDQLNLQMANLHQQPIDNDPILPSFPNDIDGYKYNNVPISNSSLPSQHVQFQTKGSSMNSTTYRSNIPPQLKSISPAQSILKNRASPQSASSTVYSKSPPAKMTKVLPDNLLQKSQESEATLQAQQNTQDTLPLDDNEDEAETIVATHVCNAYYYPNMPDELQMCPGDELIILEKFNDGWGFGQNTKGDLGVFPLDCVSYIDFNDKINNVDIDTSPVNVYSNSNYRTNLIQSKVPNISISDSYDSYSNLSIKQDYLNDSNQDYPLKENVKFNQNILYDNNDAYHNRKGYDEKMYSPIHQQMHSPIHKQMHSPIHQQVYNPINQQIYSPNHQQMYNPQYPSSTSPKYKNNQGKTNNVRFGNTQPPIHYY